MANHEKLGKCCYSEAGERCGCQRYRANLSNELICDVCFHDTGFHEKEAEETVVSAVPTSTANRSLLNQVFAGRALEEESIANELSQTFSHSRNPARQRRGTFGTFRNFDPVSAITNYNLTQNNRNRGRREVVVREPRETLVQMILLPDFGYSLQSPILSQNKYKKMIDAGYIKDVIIKENENMVQKIEVAFPILSNVEWTLRHSSTRGYTIEYNPPTGQIISYATIKRLLVNKNKLYISPKREPLPLPSDDIIIIDESNSESSTINNNLSTAFTAIDSSSDSRSISTTTLSITTPISNILSTTTSSSYDTPVIQIHNSTPSSSSTVRSEEPAVLYNNVDNFVQEITIQLQLDHKVSGSTIITINDTINVVDEILNWMEGVDDVTLLKKPIISVRTESVIDVGGVFMHVTQRFWDQVKLYDLFISNNDIFIISSNPFLLRSKRLFTLGKALFWCLIHNGAWPHWLHKFHFRYMFEMDINYIQILNEIQPQIYEIVKSIEDLNEDLTRGRIIGLNDWGIAYNLQEIDLIKLGKNELIDFIAKHEVENSRKLHLNELKKGFDIFNLIKIIKENDNIFNIKWEDFESKIYQVVISEIDLFNQFDETNNFKRVDGDTKKEILYSRFLDFLRNLKLPTERQNVLRFICGKIAIPLPINQKIQIKWKRQGSKEQPLLRVPNAKTCLMTVWLSENYDDDEIEAFDNDLRQALIIGINDGFND